MGPRHSTEAATALRRYCAEIAEISRRNSLSEWGIHAHTALSTRDHTRLPGGNESSHRKPRPGNHRVSAYCNRPCRYLNTGSQPGGRPRTRPHRRAQHRPTRRKRGTEISLRKDTSAQASCFITASGAAPNPIKWTYHNACNTNLRVAPLAFNNIGNYYTWTDACRQVAPGGTYEVTIFPSRFPPEPTNITRGVFCI